MRRCVGAVLLLFALQLLPLDVLRSVTSSGVVAGEALLEIGESGAMLLLKFRLSFAQVRRDVARDDVSEILGNISTRSVK